MDSALTAEEQAFAGEVRGFLRARPPEGFPIDGMDAGYGSGAHSRVFLRALADQGWLSMCWPRAFGRAELPMFFKLVLMEELALAGAPFGPLAGCWQKRNHARTSSRPPSTPRCAPDCPSMSRT